MNRRSILIPLVVLLAAGCGGGELPAPSARTPVIIISIDTLRSDRLPAYGYHGISTPHLDRFRGDSILFERAYTHCPLTLPAHGSLFTGLLPADHGVRDNMGFRLGAEIPTLAETLKRHGYATGGAVSAYVLRRESGIARGFDFYDDAVQHQTPDQSIGMMERSGEATAAAALDWLEKGGQEPFLLFLHLFEPHAPYDPPEPFRSLYRDRYDGEVAWVDQITGRFLDELRRRGLYDDSLIVLLSDHGEGLGDHGEAEHGLLLYRETIQIPMIVKLPGAKFAGKSVADPVQLIDVFPTVAEMTAAPLPEGLPGRSMLASLIAPPRGRRAIVSETFYPRFNLGWSELYSLVEGSSHYIHGPKRELFDLDADPAERNNLLEQERKTTAAMRRTLAPFMREPAAPAPVTAEERASLAALGYLGSTAMGKPGEARPDPREKLEAYRSIQRAFSLFRDGRHRQSLDLAEQTLREEPGIVDLWDLKSRLLASLGRTSEAIDAGRRALSLAPERVDLAVVLTSLLLDAGRIDDAEAHAGLVARHDPVVGRELQARVWLAKGDLNRAAEEARRALAESRDRVASLLTLARVERSRGELDAALALLDEAVAAKPAGRRLAGLFATRGDVLARLGRFEEGERDFRAEIAAFPQDPAAYKSLIILLVAAGRLDEAAETVRGLVDAAPLPPSYVAVCEALEVVGDRQGVRYWGRKGLERFPDHRILRRFASS
ncbi:MAG TPA: sulfatase-like hydrolase/transferase [Thermoanaerobaculia bacterium]|nr:sulfatase-like hydrolase/transferase [Thermoanaerobaculia bacterium]